MNTATPPLLSLDFLFNIGKTQWFWCLMLAVCIGLDGGALFYQHIMGVNPCELCIYVRVWVVAILFISLSGIWLRQWKIPRLTVSILALLLSLGLANETWNLIVVEYNIGNGGACGFFANFPNWAPLDKWFPDMFEVREVCQATPIIFWKFSMTHSLILTSAGFITVFLLCTIGSFIDVRKKESHH